MGGPKVRSFKSTPYTSAKEEPNLKVSDRFNVTIERVKFAVRTPLPPFQYFLLKYLSDSQMY